MKKKTKIILTVLLFFALIMSLGCISAFAESAGENHGAVDSLLLTVKSNSSEILFIASSVVLLTLGVMSGSELMPFFKKCFAYLLALLTKKKESEECEGEEDELSCKISSRLKKAESALSEIEELLKKAADEFQKLDAEARELEKMGINVSDYLSALYDAISDTMQISETLEGVSASKNTEDENAERRT